MMPVPFESRDDLMKYVDALQPRIRNAWYSLIADDLWMKTGCAVVDFAIRSDGGVAAMKLATSTGDLQLDRAAFGGIISSAPFAALPSNYKRSELELRFRFYYNPGASKRATSLPPLVGERMTAPDDELASLDPTSLPEVAYSRNSEHPPEVIKSKADESESTQTKNSVLLRVLVTSKGDVSSVRVVNGRGNGADEVAITTVLMSKFKPATKNGKTVRTEVDVRVSVP